MALIVLIEMLVGLLLTMNKSNKIRVEQQMLWIITFFILTLFTLVSDSYIKDPFTQYFIQRDQMLYYRYAVDLSEFTWSEIFKRCFTYFEYSGSPGAFYLFAAIVKIGKSMGITDLLLLLKSTVVFISSFIPVFIYKIVRIFNPSITNLSRQILPFVIFSPMLVMASQLMRDIHISLLFTILIYVSIKPNMKLRIIAMFIIVMVIFTFRIENGMFAALFFSIPIYKRFTCGSIFEKTILIIISLVIVASLAGSVLVTMNETVSLYTERSLAAASTDSLGAKLQALPIPFNYIAKTLFAQLLPFPIWLPLIDSIGEEYTYLRVVECFNPLFWIPILVYLFIIFCKYSSSWDKIIKLLFYISLLYAVVCSMSEFGTRRLFAVYPIIFAIFLILKAQLNVSMKGYRIFSYIMLIGLHLIYLVIK